LPCSDPAYPSIDLPLNPSAFDGHPNQITDDGRRRRIAWLSNLHYWLVLRLLDLGYRADAADATGQAVSHMSLVLNPLGLSGSRTRPRPLFSGFRPRIRTR
jgi:hypothetical protein